MAEIALALGGSMLWATVQVVLEKLASHAIKEAGGFLGFNEDLGMLKDSLETIKAYLIDAERKMEFEEDGIIKVWIAKVRRVTYEANDLLDEIQYHWLRHEVEGHTQVRKRFYSCRTKYKYSRRVHKMKQNLDGILASALNYNLRQLTYSVQKNLEAADEITPERVTTSLMGNEKVIGRDDKKTELIEQLMSEYEGVQVLTVYGIGGVGKTTLARYVYNDKVIQKHFELKTWVCVSDNFDVKRLTSEILDSVVIQSKKSNTRRSSKFISLDELQKALREELTGKKFLLVLDDVWNQEEHKWEEFKKPFVTAGGISKNKILVTTRSREISRKMSSMKPIELEGLSRDDFWNLFKRYAFDGSTSGSKDETLEKIGKEIVEKLKGLPLAAKTVGRLLKSDMCVEHWNDILNSELWMLSEEKDDIMQALRLSYQHLPGALKLCFAFLSLFPKDYEYKERMLKELWIANGFICPQGNRPIEDIATTYINTLLSMCMIQVHMSWANSDLERRFVVHDLLHDLAHIISKDEYLCLRDDEELQNIPDIVRHLNISSEITSSNFNNFKSTFKNLRTLVVRRSSISPSSCFNNKGLHGTFIEAKHLRALVMSHMNVTKSLSKCQLKHLRYLDLSCTDIRSLPESLCTFYNLQVLNVEECRRLYRFPVGIIKLVNLRHIYTLGAKVSTSSIKNVGKLTSLQELCFHVSKGVGHTMAELKNMNEIHEIKIEYLENISSKEEAIRARLNDKKHLISLTLKWSLEITDRIPYDEILFGLQPCKYLRILKIYNYGGAEFPPWQNMTSLKRLAISNWMNLVSVDIQTLGTLEQLRISECNKIKSLSGPILPPSLQCFEICNCEMIESLPDFGLLPSLHYLTLCGCSNLESLPENLNHLLKDLFIVNCPKVKSLPANGLPPSLRYLSIYGCPLLKESCQTDVGSDWPKISNIRYVEIDHDWISSMSPFPY